MKHFLIALKVFAKKQFAKYIRTRAADAKWKPQFVETFRINCNALF
jgi:hypothetical protein